MASFGSLIDRLPAILEKITKHNADVLSGATDSPNGKKTQNILVNSPTIRELSAVKAVNQAVKTPGGFELTPHAKPRRVDLEDLLWIPIHYFKKSVLGKNKLYVCGRHVRTQTEITSASNIKFPIPKNEIPVEVFCLPTKHFCQYYTVKIGEVFPYNSCFPSNSLGNEHCWSESYRDNLLNVLKHLGYKTEGDASFICEQAWAVADEYLRLALQPSTPIPVAVGSIVDVDDEAPVKSTPVSLFGSGCKRSSPGSADREGLSRGCATNSIKCDLNTCIKKGTYLVYKSNVNGMRTSNQIVKVVRKGNNKYRLQMSNDDVIEPTDAFHPSLTRFDFQKGLPVPLTFYALRKMSEFTNIIPDAPTAAAKRKAEGSPSASPSVTAKWDSSTAKKTKI